MWYTDPYVLRLILYTAIGVIVVLFLFTIYFRGERNHLHFRLSEALDQVSRWKREYGQLEESIHSKVQNVLTESERLRKANVDVLAQRHIAVLQAMADRKKAQNAGPAQRRDAELGLREALISHHSVFASVGAYKSEMGQHIEELIPPPTEADFKRQERAEKKAKAGAEAKMHAELDD